MLVELDEKTYVNVLAVTHVQNSFVERSTVDKNSVGQLIHANKNQVELVEIFVADTSLQVEGVSIKEVVEVINKGLLLYENTLPIKGFLMVKLSDSYVNALSVTYVRDSEIEEPIGGKAGAIHSMKKIPGAEVGGVDLFVKGMTAKEVSSILNKRLKEMF